MGLFGSGKPQPPPQPPPAPATAVPGAPTRPTPGLTTGSRGAFAPLDDVLRATVESGASDLHLSVGSPPTLRINGRLVRMETRALFPEDMDNMAREIGTGDHIHKLNTE